MSYMHYYSCTSNEDHSVLIHAANLDEVHVILDAYDLNDHTSIRQVPQDYLHLHTDEELIINNCNLDCSNCDQLYRPIRCQASH